MASSNTSENTECKTCQCGEGEKSIWNPKSSESADKQPQNCPNCQIIKSGYLLISSRGIGWTSWKKRWFILTRTSLVFYRTDPNTQKGNEANPTLGGIDLTNSGSVVVKADRRLLTVTFPDGQDGRNFTLKGDTSEELQEWKVALEGVLAQAPSTSLDRGTSGTFINEIVEPGEPVPEQCTTDKKSVNPMVIGRPVILALEETDGSPSFLEKALRFIEEHGIKVEGILRQSADVEEVERREREYEQGKTEFSAEEDAHVIGDCIKHVLRELPSSPVPASCCTALVEAYKTDRKKRVRAIRDAIAETFPEPNLRLLQRILKMMLTVASHKSENRMSLSALAACMAPLLLRPLLAGECELEDDFNMGGDGSIQLLKAAAAANHAQAIVIIMLEEHDHIFEELSQDGSYSSDMYSGSEQHDTEGSHSDNDIDDDGYHDSHNGRGSNAEHSSDGSVSGSGSRSYTGSGSRSYTGSGSRSYTGSGSGSGSRSYSHSGSRSYSRSGSRSYSRSGSRSFSGSRSRSYSGSGSRSRSGSRSGSRSYIGSEISNHEEEDHNSCSSSHEYTNNTEATKTPKVTSNGTNLVKSINQDPKIEDAKLTEEISASKVNVAQNDKSDSEASPSLQKSVDDIHTSRLQKCATYTTNGSPAKFRNRSSKATSSMRKPTKWGQNSARKNLPTEQKDSADDEIAIQKLETEKSDLENKIVKEVTINENLRENIEKRKEALHERQSALQRDVDMLREQLQKERDLRLALESGLMNMRPGHASITSAMDSKTRADLEEINQVEADIISLKQKAADLRGKISIQQQNNQQSERHEMESDRTVDNAIPHQTENSIIVSSPVNTEDAMAGSQTPSSPNKDQETKVVNNLVSRENTTSEANHSNSSTNKKPVGHESASKKYNSKGFPSLSLDNPKFEVNMDAAYLKAHKLNSPTFGDLKHSHKLPRQPTNKSRIKENDDHPPQMDESATLTRNYASKRSSYRADSSKQPTSSARSEDGNPPPSSALVRLTNRLYFLKERRIQLAQELQNLEANPQPPPNNSK